MKFLPYFYRIIAPNARSTLMIMQPRNLPENYIGYSWIELRYTMSLKFCKFWDYRGYDKSKIRIDMQVPKILDSQIRILTWSRNIFFNYLCNQKKTYFSVINDPFVQIGWNVKGYFIKKFPLFKIPIIQNSHYSKFPVSKIDVKLFIR